MHGDEKRYWSGKEDQGNPRSYGWTWIDLLGKWLALLRKRDWSLQPNDVMHLGKLPHKAGARWNDIPESLPALTQAGCFSLSSDIIFPSQGGVPICACCSLGVAAVPCGYKKSRCSAWFSPSQATNSKQSATLWAISSPIVRKFRTQAPISQWQQRSQLLSNDFLSYTRGWKTSASQHWDKLLTLEAPAKDVNIQLVTANGIAHAKQNLNKIQED